MSTCDWMLVWMLGTFVLCAFGCCRIGGEG